MRISGGEFGGRRVKVPAGDGVRPTQNRVRGALFSMLAAQVPGARVLDLFAGTGAVGIEALSRGAAEVVWVESNRRHAATLTENVQALAGGHPRVFCDDALRWLQRAEVEPFDLVFADPPYAWAQAHGFAELAALLGTRGWVRAGAFFVAEQPVGLPVAPLADWDLLRDRAYGDSRLVVYRALDRTAESDRISRRVSGRTDQP